MLNCVSLPLCQNPIYTEVPPLPLWSVISELSEMPLHSSSAHFALKGKFNSQFLSCAYFSSWLELEYVLAFSFFPPLQFKLQEGRCRVYLTPYFILGARRVVNVWFKINKWWMNKRKYPHPSHYNLKKMRKTEQVYIKRYTQIKNFQSICYIYSSYMCVCVHLCVLLLLHYTQTVGRKKKKKKKKPHSIRKSWKETAN